MTKPKRAVKESGALPLAARQNATNYPAGIEPYYTTSLGAAYLRDSLEVLRAIPDNTINAVITSPPYALHFKKEYGNASKNDYVSWFIPFAVEIFRVLK